MLVGAVDGLEGPLPTGIGKANQQEDPVIFLVGVGFSFEW